MSERDWDATIPNQNRARFKCDACAREVVELRRGVCIDCFADEASVPCEPLTRERARAWLEAERARIGARPWGTNSAADFARFAALTNKVTGRQLSDDDLDALASLLVDAARGVVR